MNKTWTACSFSLVLGLAPFVVAAQESDPAPLTQSELDEALKQEEAAKEEADAAQKKLEEAQQKYQEYLEKLAQAEQNVADSENTYNSVLAQEGSDDISQIVESLRKDDEDIASKLNAFMDAHNTAGTHTEAVDEAFKQFQASVNQYDTESDQTNMAMEILVEMEPKAAYAYHQWIMNVTQVSILEDKKLEGTITEQEVELLAQLKANQDTLKQSWINATELVDTIQSYLKDKVYPSADQPIQNGETFIGMIQEGAEKEAAQTLLASLTSNADYFNSHSDIIERVVQASTIHTSISQAYSDLNWQNYLLSKLKWQEDPILEEIAEAEEAYQQALDSLTAAQEEVKRLQEEQQPEIQPDETQKDPSLSEAAPNLPEAAPNLPEAAPELPGADTDGTEQGPNEDVSNPDVDNKDPEQPDETEKDPSQGELTPDTSETTPDQPEQEVDQNTDQAETDSSTEGGTSDSAKPVETASTTVKLEKTAKTKGVATGVHFPALYGLLSLFAVPFLKKHD